jgi:hypothetical protein
MNSQYLATALITPEEYPLCTSYLALFLKPTSNCPIMKRNNNILPPVAVMVVLPISIIALSQFMT